MADQSKLDKTYLKMCENWAQLSHANRMKVGCLIVKDNQIISDGFNGTPAGFDNNCEGVKSILPKNSAGTVGVFQETPEWALGISEVGETLPEVLHAESNAITKLAKSTNSSEGATLYCTLSPCFECSKLIIQAGIKRVVYSELYRHGNGLELLCKAGIIIDYIGEEDE